VTEDVPAGSSLSPTVTFTVENTGNYGAAIGVVTATAPSFHITQDGCSRTSLGPRARCQVTLRYQPHAAGHESGSLIVPVTGRAAATASLQGVAH
jgi:hypothetical protein